jgi:peptidoglycan/xylan/chitin deacetylase (PgdA/CDA1 family)
MGRRLASLGATAVLVAACSGTVPAVVQPGGPAAATSPAYEAAGLAEATARPTAAPAPVATAESIPAPPSFWPVPSGSAVPDAGFVLRVPILTYHRIVPQDEAGDALPGLVVSPELFDAHMAALHEAGWHTLTVAELAETLASGVAVPPRTFAITIDDGWSDGYTYALPILVRYGFRATYYVIGGRVGVLSAALSAAQVVGLVDAGMEIGDHTWDHQGLANLDAVRLHDEVAAPAGRIRSLVGQSPVTFAYPSGRYDAAAAAELEADGFSMAVTTQSGALETWADRFAVPRLRVGPYMSPEGLLGLLRTLEPGS